MGIPNLLDPRMLSQVGETPPLQQSLAPINLTPPPAPAPAPVAPSPLVLPPDLGGMGQDALPRSVTREKPQPTFAQILMQSIPLLVAGIAAHKGGPGATTGLLAGYADAMEKRRLLEEKQYEFDVQTAATEDTRRARIQEYRATQQARIGNFYTDVLTRLQGVDDPAYYAAVLQGADETGSKAFGTPPGFFTKQLGGKFDNAKAMTKAQKDAQDRLALVKTQLGENFDDAVANNATLTDPKTGKRQSIRELMALAGLDVTGPEGQPMATTPKTPENEATYVKRGIQEKQKTLGRPLTPAETNETVDELRSKWADATRTDTSTTSMTGMVDGVPTLMNRDPKTGRATPVLDATGKPVRAVPSQAIINMGTQEKFANEEFTADRPDPLTANKIDPFTGLTPNAQYQGGIAWALTGQMPALGQSNSGQMGRARQSIINKGSAVAAAAGVDIPTLRAEYKAKAPALANLTTFYTRTAAFAGSAEDALQLAEQQSALVPRGQTPIANTFTQWLATGDKALSSDPALAQLQLYIYTAAREYAKVTSGGAGSVAALTDYASQQVDKLLSAAQSPETFAKVAEGMRNDMRVTTSNQLKVINKTSKEIADFLSGATGFAMVGPNTTTTETTGTGRQTAAGPAGGPPPPPPPKADPSRIAIDGLTVTGPTGVPMTFKTIQQAQAMYNALKATYGRK